MKILQYKNKCMNCIFSMFTAFQPGVSPRVPRSGSCRDTVVAGMVSICRRAWAATVHKANPVIWQQICKRDKLRSCRGSNPASISNRGFSQQRLKGLEQNYCVWSRNGSSHLPCKLVAFVPGYCFSRITRRIRKCICIQCYRLMHRPGFKGGGINVTAAPETQF